LPLASASGNKYREKKGALAKSELQRFSSWLQPNIRHALRQSLDPLCQLCRGKFGWQDEFFAVSVSETMVEGVRKYIANQEERHRKKSFDEEFKKSRV
jgi:hypothetical protein